MRWRHLEVPPMDDEFPWHEREICLPTFCNKYLLMENIR